MSSLKQKAMAGVAWSFVEKWGQQGITFVVFLILSRLLTPETFGLVASATVFTAFVQILLDQGLLEAVVQRDTLDKEHLDTAFWAALMMGGVLTIIGVAGADLVARFFSEPELTLVVQALSLNFTIKGLSSTQQAILQRDLKFKALSIRTLAGIATGGIVGVVMAFSGYGVWSLVAMTLTQHGVSTLLLWILSDWRPSLTFSRQHYVELMSFGINVLGSRFLSYFNRRSDNLIIGFYLGSTLLGYYTVAYRLLPMTILLVVGITSSIAFPVFSRIQDDPERLRHAFYKATRLTALVAFPACLGLSVLAPELVVALFGEQWEPSGPVLRVLALIGIVHSLQLFQGSLVRALGKPQWQFWTMLASAVLNVIGFLIAVRWGITAVAVAYVIRGYLLSPLLLLLVRRLIDLDLKKYVAQLIPSLISALLMCLVIIGLKSLVGGTLGLYSGLAVYIFTGIGTYLLILRIINPDLLKQALQMIRILLPKRFAKVFVG